MEKPSLSRHVATVRELTELAAEEPQLFEPRAVHFVRNFTVEPVETLLKIEGFRRGWNVSVSYSDYDPSPVNFGHADATAIVVAALRLEDLSPALAAPGMINDPSAARASIESAVNRHLDLLRAAIDRSGAPALTFNYLPPARPLAGLADAQALGGQVNIARRANLALVEAIEAEPRMFLIDLEHELSVQGLGKSEDARGSRMSSSPFSQDALRVVAGALARSIGALNPAPVKCVVLDCDGTLWGGVVGEDGVGGIQLGQSPKGSPFVEFQRRLLELKRQGTVLAIASKNEEADVHAVLTEHPDCLLSPEDFVATRINWEDKASNVNSIAQELNIGLDSLIFVDDNPAECERVASALPEVSVKLVTAGNPSAAIDDERLESLVRTSEDTDRTEMYRAESERRNSRSEVASLESYLASLEMVVTIGMAGPEDLNRIAQLVKKTNQFNLTTRRHELDVISALIEDSSASVVWISVEDRFGPSGLVGCGIAILEGETARIDTLLMSCRVIGREIEKALLNKLGREARRWGAKVLVGEYRPSERNQQVECLYADLGFTPHEAKGEFKRWTFNTANEIAVPRIYEVIEIGAEVANG